MASSLLKKIRIRAARCTDQLLQLRAECATPEDAQRLEQCIAAMREASGRMDDVFHDYKPAVAPRRQQARSTPPLPPSDPGKAPVYGPATGVTEAQAPQPKTWATREAGRRDDDDELPFIPGKLTTEQEVELILRGKMGGFYDNKAAVQLAADADSWNLLDAAERLASIRELALKLEEDDPMDDVQLGKPAGAPAAQVVDPDNVVF